MRYIEVEQTHSPIRRNGAQRATLVGLGLNRIGRTNWVPDTPAIRGMIAKVAHLVRITHDPANPKPAPESLAYNESFDVGLLRELAFDKVGIGLGGDIWRAGASMEDSIASVTRRFSRARLRISQWKVISIGLTI